MSFQMAKILNFPDKKAKSEPTKEQRIQKVRDILHKANVDIEKLKSELSAIIDKYRKDDK
jgi:hypothetical protein